MLNTGLVLHNVKIQQATYNVVVVRWYYNHSTVVLQFDDSHCLVFVLTCKHPPSSTDVWKKAGMAYVDL